MKIKFIQVENLIAYARTIDGFELETKSQHLKFLFEIDDKGFCFTPIRTGMPRFESINTIKKILERYNSSNSLSPKDYLNITANSSYTLVIIKKYIDSQMGLTNNNRDLGISLLKTLEVDPLIDFSDNLLEKYADFQLLDEIPIIKTFIAIAKTSSQISNFLFMNKIWKFLERTQDIPKDEISTFSEKLKNDNKFRRKVGDNIILYIDKLNDMQKPSIYGKLFNAYIRGRIDYPLFLRLSRILERFEIEDEPILRQYYSINSREYSYKSDDLDRLFICGLLKPNLGFVAREDVHGGYYKNEIGEQFIKYALD